MKNTDDGRTDHSAMHCKWRRKRRAWGCEVIRALEMDDPVRLIRAFQYPTELAFVDLNTQVEGDYGGYAWTDMMHLYFGDTALHIALKWKRHRAVKALLSLRPDWTVPNEKGVTAQELALEVYGRDIVTLREEQEREYENGAMLAEEGTTRRLMDEENAARERACQAFLRELHAKRTVGVQEEAAILLKCGRILAGDDAGAADGDHRQSGNSARVASRGITAGRWAAHICRELRRNRFAAHRRAMRRNVVPARAPSPSFIASSRVSEATGDVGSGGHLSGERGERLRGVITPPRSAIGGGGSRDSPQISGGGKGGARAPSSPAGGRSPGSRSSSSPMMSGGGGALRGTFNRFERSSRMAAIRMTHILAAEKSIPPRVKPRARLQRKMARREASMRAASQTTAEPAASRSPKPVTLSAEQVREETTGTEIDNDHPDGGRSVKPETRPCVVTPMDSFGEGFRDREGACPPGSVNTIGGADKDGKAGHRPGVGDTSSATPSTVTPPHPGSSGPTSTETGDRRTGFDKSSNSSSIIANRFAMATNGIPATSLPSETADQSKLWSRALASLRGMRQQSPPVRYTLEALLNSTVLDPEGARVSAPTFPRVSVQHELKYSGPMGPGQAMALAAVVAARPGVLTHLNLCGKRLGDKGTAILAPTIPTIRSVDLRRNNIGDRGVCAIAAALKSAALVAERNACPILLENLSLAGNRVGDLGANALSSVLEGDDSAKGLSPGETKGFPRWLSLTGNPRVSDAAMERLLRAAAAAAPSARNGASNVPRVVV